MTALGSNKYKYLSNHKWVQESTQADHLKKAVAPDPKCCNESSQGRVNQGKFRRMCKSWKASYIKMNKKVRLYLKMEVIAVQLYVSITISGNFS